MSDESTELPGNLLRDILAGIEELRGRPGHCSVVVQAPDPHHSLPRDLRKAFPREGARWTHGIFVPWSGDQLPYPLVAEWVVEGDALFFRMLSQQGFLVFEERWRFDGPEVLL